MTNQMRNDFEAWHGGRYLGLQSDIAFAAWQAATKAERERCARVCESMTDHATGAKALDKVRATRGKGGALELGALRFESTVSFYNSSVEKCARAIRQGVGE